MSDAEKQPGITAEGSHAGRDDKTLEGGLSLYDQSSSQPPDSKAGETPDNKNHLQQKLGLRQQLPGPQHGQAQSISEQQNHTQLTHQQNVPPPQLHSNSGQPQQKQPSSLQTPQGLQPQQLQHDARQTEYQQGQQAMVSSDRQSRAPHGQSGQSAQGDKPPTQTSGMDQHSKSGSQHPEDFQTGQHSSLKFPTLSHRDPSSEQDDRKPSLRPVVAHIRKLRVAVNTAVRLFDAQLEDARKKENSVSDQERTALSSRRDALLEEVHSKNERLKLLINQLRELYRASLTFRNNGGVYFNKATGSIS